MGSFSPQYDKQVISKIGKDIWKDILDNVRCGTMTSQQMSDIAGLLNSKVSGSHMRRKSDGKVSDEAEMREILGEYYNEEMFDMGTHEAVTKLV